jgi:molybdopterin-containing oxidoreductase family iron-sulfur binding subunit
MSEITIHPSEPELAAVRERLQQSRGRQFWRSLDELADTPAFQEVLQREFPRGAAELTDPVTRRTFLKLMGASLALAGLSGCTAAIRQPQEQVAPFARAPLEQMPGIPLYYATALSLDGFGLGVAVKNHDGRPTKIEGNPAHPASLGATDIYAQAEILSLYDPDRPETVLRRGAITTWELFVPALNEVMQIQRALQGQGLRILTPTITSPSLAAQFAALLETLPAARWIQYDPVGRSNTYAGAQLAFGEPVEPRYNFAEASVIVALDADFLTEGPGRVRYARDFMDGRRVRQNSQAMSRLYVVEPALTSTGITADNRLPLKASAVAGAAATIAAALGVSGAAAPAGLPGADFLAAAAADLRAAGSRGLVVVGEAQPPVVHALAHAINAALGAVGTTVEYTDPVAVQPADQNVALRELVADLNADAVEVLIVIDANPVYTAPADLNFAAAMQRARFKAVLGPYEDETAALADWFVPQAHLLEAWTDLRAYDGTVTIVQPLILPLYGGRSAHELLAVLNGQIGPTDYDIVRAYWQETSATEGDAFENFFKGALNNGVVPGTRLPARSVSLAGNLSFALPEPIAGLELNLRADPTVYDGRYANNGWLQELPKPTTKLTWDNAALVSARTAIRLLGLNFDMNDLAADDETVQGLALDRLIQANGSMIDVSHAGASLRLPIWIVPGHADETITLHLGYGRTRAGRVGSETGFNAYALRSSAAPWIGEAQASATNERYKLVSTQDHWTLSGRDILRVGAFAAFQENPKSISEAVYTKKYGSPESPDYISLLPGDGNARLPSFSSGNQWGMSIDLGACIGCNACTIACQAENNIPIVGKDEVAVGREMHWIRIDRYFAGDNFDNPETYVMPVTCMHCDQAPCELVCPVAATVHDHEGINNMVYNRCVGTKYCSNNCPYKVRRFNFLQYNDVDTGSIKLMRNPEVTVRNRGVMEKCSFCIQRITDVRIKSKVAGNRPIRDGEILTACQQVCPTQAIVFGDINDEQSRVAQLKAEPHDYTVLNELNVMPRVSYLARVRNPNEAL